MTICTIDPRIMDRLRLAYAQVPPLSAAETRAVLKTRVPQASEAELDEALYLAGHVDNGRA